MSLSVLFPPIPKKDISLEVLFLNQHKVIFHYSMFTAPSSGFDSSFTLFVNTNNPIQLRSELSIGKRSMLNLSYAAVLLDLSSVALISRLNGSYIGIKNLFSQLTRETNFLSLKFTALSNG